MSNTFDAFYNKLLKETNVPTTTTTEQPSSAQGSQPNQQANQQTQAYQKTPSPNTPPQAGQQPNDQDLMKLLQQKMQDQKFKQDLLNLLNPQAKV